jgi:hypothetical protein
LRYKSQVFDNEHGPIKKQICLLCLHQHPASSHARHSFPEYGPDALLPIQTKTTASLIENVMFGALNRFIGRLDGEPVQQPRNGPSDNAYGFQVLRNKDTELPLEPWFDFIVGINGHPIVSAIRDSSNKNMRGADAYSQEDPDPNLFATEVRNCAGSSLTLEIWSAKVL